MKVLIVPDKFKGTLRAQEAAEAIAAGWREVRAGDDLELLPMSDGGDGFGEIVGQALGGTAQRSATVNAAHEPVQAQWWWSESNQTAVVESANIIGLAMLPPGKFHPFELDTLGLGQTLRQIAQAKPGCRLIVGIGGSATNDAGFGMARGLGYRFNDFNSGCLDRWGQLSQLLKIDPPGDPVRFGEVVIATDVQNPLLGPEGATRVYGPQKGMRPEDFPIADGAFTRLTERVRKDLALDYSEEPGTGAAGGLGYGLRVFLGGEFEPGFDIFARLARLHERIQGADLIITAEGSIDAQTEMGKGTGAVAELAAAAGKPCIGLAGYLPNPGSIGRFRFALGIHPHLASLEEAKRDAAPWLRKLAAEAARRF